jgi:hypothetical protein
METLDILKDLAMELITACSDVDLLDLICKILASDIG